MILIHDIADGGDCACEVHWDRELYHIGLVSRARKQIDNFQHYKDGLLDPNVKGLKYQDPLLKIHSFEVRACKSLSHGQGIYTETCTVELYLL